MRTFVTSLLLPFFTTCVIAQSINIKGTVVQASDASPVLGAAIRFVSLKDSTVTRGGYSERDGKFTIKDVPLGAYKLSVSAIGFRKLESTVFVREGKPDVGTFRLQQDTVRAAAINV